MQSALAHTNRLSKTELCSGTFPLDYNTLELKMKHEKPCIGTIDMRCCDIEDFFQPPTANAPTSILTNMLFIHIPLT